MKRRSFIKMCGTAIAIPAAVVKAVTVKIEPKSIRTPLHLALRKELDEAISIVKKNELFNRNRNLIIVVTTKVLNLILNGSTHELSKERIDKIKKRIALQPRINFEYKDITIIENTLIKGIMFFVCYRDYPITTLRIGCQLDDNGSVIERLNYYEKIGKRLNKNKKC